jgi:ribosomal protein S18 acetylase RimI-like enzyme
VEELRPSEELWERVAASFELFGVDPQESVDELRAIETDVLLPGGKRWFGVRDDRGTVVSLAALVLLADVGYVDNVATFPDARGRGYASAITRAVIGAARGAGVEGIFLLADPDEAAVVRMYERLGFRDAGRLASTRGPVGA